MGYETYEDQLEDEQDFLGLYESELNKQIHLRNKQRKEWDMMKKRMEHDEEKKMAQITKERELVEEEAKEEERIEIEETRVSKKLTSAMVRSALEEPAQALNKIVDVLQNQNGKNSSNFATKHFHFFLFKIFPTKLS